MINFGTGTGCLTAPSPRAGESERARGTASADAAVGGMKNPAMQHCFLMSHLSLSLLDSLPCRERDGSCPKSPSEQLLLEQSEEILPHHAPAAGDPARPPAPGLPAAAPLPPAAAATGAGGEQGPGPPLLPQPCAGADSWGQQPGSVPSWSIPVLQRQSQRRGDPSAPSPWSPSTWKSSKTLHKREGLGSAATAQEEIGWERKGQEEGAGVSILRWARGRDGQGHGATSCSPMGQSGKLRAGLTHSTSGCRVLGGASN